MKVEMFGKTLVDCTIIELLTGGQSETAQLTSLVEALQELVNEGKGMAALDRAFKDEMELVEAFCAAVCILMDPSPTAMSECKVPLKRVKDIVLGLGMPGSWGLVSDALDEGHWATLKADFRRAMTSDTVLGSEMVAVLKALDENREGAFAEALRKLPGWKARCRKGGCDAAQAKIVDHLVRLADDLAGSSDTKKLDKAKDLDQFLSEALAVLKDSVPLRTKIQQTKKAVQTICEECSRNILENEMMSSVQKFSAQPDEITGEALRRAYAKNIGVKFTGAEHCDTLRSGIAALLKALARPLGPVSEEPSELTSHRSTMLDDARMAVGIVGMIHSSAAVPGDEVQKAELKLLEVMWAVLFQAALLAELESSATDLEKANVKEAWNGLSASLRALDGETYLLGSSPDDLALPNQLETFKLGFKALVDEARHAKVAHGEQCVAELLAKAASEMRSLDAIAGGIAGGTWKESCNGRDWPTVLAKAQEVLFGKEQKGISRKLTAQRAALSSALKELKAECANYEMEDAYEETHQEGKKVLERAGVTITEARLIQLIKDPKMTAQIKHANLQQTLDEMVELGLKADDIEQCIYDKAHDILKS